MITILFYIVGYIAAYFFLKDSIVQKDRYTWTKEDRIIGLIFSIGSWITIVLMVVVVIALEYSKDLTKPVKW